MSLLGKRKRFGKLGSSKKTKIIKPLQEIIFESYEQELSEKITDAFEKNANIRPGHDCCMNCAVALEDNPVCCATCEAVKYCSDECRRADLHHVTVCDALSYAKEDVKVPVTSLVIDRYVAKSLKQKRIGSSMDEFLDGLGGLDPFSRTGRALSELLWRPLTAQKAVEDMELGEKEEVHIIQAESRAKPALWKLVNPEGETRIVDGAYNEIVKKHKPKLVIIWQPGFGLNEDNCKAFCSILAKEAPDTRLLVTENSEMELLETGSLLAENKWMPVSDCQPNDFAPLCFKQSTSFANDIYREGSFLTICSLMKAGGT